MVALADYRIDNGGAEEAFRRAIEATLAEVDAVYRREEGKF